MSEDGVVEESGSCVSCSWSSLLSSVSRVREGSEKARKIQQAREYVRSIYICVHTEVDRATSDRH